MAKSKLLEYINNSINKTDLFVELTEIAHRNPIWIHTKDAKRLGVNNGDLLKITTEIGWFIDKVWVTESIKPGVVACSHHIGRWRRQNDQGNRFMTNTVTIKNIMLCF